MLSIDPVATAKFKNIVIMAFRSAESPMDFEWNTGHGPIDTKSPFLQRPPRNTMKPLSGATGQKRRKPFFR